MGLAPSFPDRKIHNIYFDTSSLDTYHENAFGVGQRKKFRLRWYGDTDWPEGKAVFEIKERYLEQGKKTTYAVDPGPPDDFQGLLYRLRALKGIPSALQPVLGNSYARAYYGLSNGSFRITIDWDQQFRGLLFQHSQRGMLSPFSWIADPAVILELKYDAELDEEIDPILQNLPFRFSKNSKYVQGVEMLYK
ncbi:MAG: VTC domain-containing protein [Saprospirales bacterium]|nr:VTC domain-containing protein [Saprospirales bacterium]